MMISKNEIVDIGARCAQLSSVGCVYDELLERYPGLSPEDARQKFLSLLYLLMVQGHLRFLGETQVFRGEEVVREKGVLRLDVMPNQDLTKIILEGKYWEATKDQQRRITERLMFDSAVFGRHEAIVGGLRQPLDQSPQAIVELIRSKWPVELLPRRRRGTTGFDPLWFEKWVVEWANIDV